MDVSFRARERVSSCGNSSFQTLILLSAVPEISSDSVHGFPPSQALHLGEEDGSKQGGSER